MSAEKFSLNWNKFSDHLQLMLKDLYQNGQYADVTLVSDDQTQFKAHKIVLSACSPVFKKIIDNNPSQHPLIYLRGIQSFEMESILQFMYLGEGRFYYERMGEFLKVSKDLEVKEISKKEEFKIVVEESVSEEAVSKKAVAKETAIKDERAHFDASIPTPENNIRKKEPCNQISITNPKSTECPDCGKGFARKHVMLDHYRNKHEGIKYPCNLCDYKANDRSNLRQHVKSKHEGVKYPCNQCYYQATMKNDLKRHIIRHHGSKVYTI